MNNALPHDQRSRCQLQGPSGAFSYWMKHISVAIVLLATVAVPSLGLALGASSMAAGTAVIASVAVLLFLGLIIREGATRNMITATFIVIIIMMMVLANGMQSILINNTFNVDRFLQTYAFLFLFILGTAAWALLAWRVTNHQVDFAIRFVFYTLLFVGLVGTTGYSPFFNSSKPVVFFSEPSHFAVNFGSFLLYMVILSQPRTKFFFLLLVIMLAFLLQNLTLLVIAIFVSAFAFRLNKLVFAFLAGAVLLPIILYVTDITYYTSRLDFSKDNKNLSALVYMSGWEVASLNLRDSFGLGIGFEQLGFIGNRGEIREKIASLAPEVADLNLMDGGTVAAKLISEFGMLAVMGLLIYLVCFVRSAKWVRGVSLRKIEANEPKKIFFLSCLVMYSFELFVRGTGYYSSTGFIFVASIIWLILSKFKLRRGMR